MLPRVTVVVPVLDESGRIGACLDALRAQTWPADRLEILVVDNGSVDETRARVREHEVTLLVERRARTPYTARNRGIYHARGEWIAFTDARCVPHKSWIENAVRRLEAEGADLLGGHMNFVYSHPPRTGEVVDALSNADHETTIPRGAAATCNLFVHRRVFEDLGPFREDRRSGGDTEFTSRAVGAGYTLVYGPDSVVDYPARCGRALARKHFRVGCGHTRIWRERGEPRAGILPRILNGFRPVRPRALRALLERRGPPEARRRFARVWLAYWGYTAVQSLGQLREWLAPSEPGR